MGEIPAAVCRGCHCRALSTGWEEVEIGQASRQATLPYNGGREVHRYFRQCLYTAISILVLVCMKAQGISSTHTQSLLSQINELDVQKLLAQDWHSSSIHHIGHRPAQSFHQVGQTATCQ